VNTCTKNPNSTLSGLDFSFAGRETSSKLCELNEQRVWENSPVDCLIAKEESPVTSTKNDRFLRLKTLKNGRFFVVLHKFRELFNFLTNYLTTYFRPKIAQFSLLMITPN